MGEQDLDPSLDDELLELFQDKEMSCDEVYDASVLDPIDGLHWEVGTEIKEALADKREHMATKIKDGYKHLFSTPVDAMFALLPYIFWQLICHEINRYAKQYMDRKKKKYINAYKWKPTSVQEILTFFGILINAMLFPQTG